MWSAHWLASLGNLDAETWLHAELLVASKEVHSPDDPWERLTWACSKVKCWLPWHHWEVCFCLLPNPGFTLGSCFDTGVPVHLVQCGIGSDSHLSLQCWLTNLDLSIWLLCYETVTYKCRKDFSAGKVCPYWGLCGVSTAFEIYWFAPYRNVHSSAHRSVTQFCTENVQCTKDKSV